jgi:hypothetical protein
MSDAFYKGNAVLPALVLSLPLLSLLLLIFFFFFDLIFLLIFFLFFLLFFFSPPAPPPRPRAAPRAPGELNFSAHTMIDKVCKSLLEVQGCEYAYRHHDQSNQIYNQIHKA